MLRFTLGGHAVTTDARTRINGGTCSDIRNGTVARIEGERRSDGVIYATRVSIEKD
jgi:hypothetical protein